MYSRLNPKINFYEAEYYLRSDSSNPRIIENLKVYNLLKELTLKAYFSSRDKYEKRWGTFSYLLEKRNRQNPKNHLQQLAAQRPEGLHLGYLKDFTLRAYGAVVVSELLDKGVFVCFNP